MSLFFVLVCVISRRPNKKLVREFESLLDEDTERMVKQSVPLVLAHLVRVTCSRAGPPESDEQKRCFREFASEYVSKMYQRLQGG